jgi:hypothetical protein
MITIPAFTETPTHLDPLFVIIFSVSFATFMFLVGLLLGHIRGKEVGQSKEIENRMCRDIIDHVRKEGSIPPYYSEKDIKRAQQYGKREGFFFTLGNPPAFKVIRGGKK